MTSNIRPAQTGDIPALTEIYNHYVRETSITFDIEPKSIAERTEWFGHYLLNTRHQLWVAELDKNVVGYASSSKFREKDAYQTSVETTIYLSPDANGLGLGTQLYEALFAALQDQDVHQAFAGITLPNEPSQALHRKFGFQTIGTFSQVGRKFDQYWDVEWLQRAVKL